MKLFSLLILPLLAECKFRQYNLTLQATYMSKDGNGRPYLTINGDTPGPVIEGDEGDLIQVNVVNGLFTEATVHWHGVYQVDKYWNDGVPGVTQWPIEARGSYTYEFTFTGQYGSYFYHGHFGPAFADGQRGPIWIRPAPSRPRPYGLISEHEDEIEAMRHAEQNPHHLMVADWNFEGMDILILQFRDTGITPSCSASITTNAKGRTMCIPKEVIDAHSTRGKRTSLGCYASKQQELFANVRECQDTFTDFEVIQAKKGEKYLWLNFINPGSNHELRISVDEHDMYIVAADGEFVHPTKVQAINVNLGERISVLVKLDQEPGDYAIRLIGLDDDQLLQGLSILRYHDVVEKRTNGIMEVPTSEPWIDIVGQGLKSARLMDELNDLKPYPKKAPPQISDHTLRFLANRTGPSSWVLASEPHQGFRQQLPPLLWNPESKGPTSITGMKNGSVVDIIFESTAQSMHPFHKHNHKAFIIGRGDGFFPWPDVKTAIQQAPEHFNMVDPPYRDGVRLAAPVGSWSVIRYEISFPALSMLHCHRIAHFAAGQQIVLFEGGEAMSPLPEHIKHLTHADFVPPLRYGPLD